MLEYALLLVAAILAGALNSIAGGGSFISLPALLFYGVPPTVANATSAASLWPGYVGSLAGFRHDVAPPPALGRGGVALIALAGGVSGALLLLATGNHAFSVVVPWLMAFATSIFVLGPQIRRLTSNIELPTPLVAGALFVTCVYGGYFNGGAGIVIVALLGLLGDAPLLSLVATKSLFSVVMGGVSVATYAAFGVINWPLALIMAIGAAAGGLLGARLSYRLPPWLHRGGIVVIGVVMTILMFNR